MKGVIFDLDGVLVDSMPSHVEAWKEVFARIAGLEVSERELYLLEGMRGKELIRKILEDKGVSDYSLIDKVSDEKDKLFQQMRRVNPFQGTGEIIDRIRCAKAVVSGSGKQDVVSILDATFGSDKFDVIVTADDVDKGKPDPTAFLKAAKQMNIEKKSAVVVENAPLGARAANNADILCYVALNNTPLSKSDFTSIVAIDRIFDTTGSLKTVLSEWCG